MIPAAERRNPLRWYLAALLLAILLTLSEGYPLLKFQSQRLAELLPALGLLLWCFRRQPRSFFEAPAISGWYGLGLLGLAAVALVGGAVGPVPWISLGFLGLALLQFGLLPLLQPAWRQHRADTARLLALFAVVLVGMDVGLSLVARLYGLPVHTWVNRLTPEGGVFSLPYLHLNARWANQMAVLLLWTFLPLLQQLQSGTIRRWRGFWWPICGAVPLVCLLQIGLSQGDGAALASVLGTVMVGWQAWRSGGERRRLYGTGLLLLLGAALGATVLTLALSGGSFFSEALQRNSAELLEGGSEPSMRLSNWLVYGRALLASPLWGVGIQAVPAGAGLCGPHNLPLALLYWLGILGTGCALLLATGFVPKRWSGFRHNAMAAPLLVALFAYQLVDDIWLRPLALALLLVLLPSLLPDGALDGWPVPSRLSPVLARFALPPARYRLIALIGVLLILVSAVVPGGVGFQPSPAVATPGSTCLLFF
ncbi:O-antigen ligase [Cyanobium sp. NIES-981]|uniref:O-antigen ligase family protein n=1 Tax=Cyanobium sp. NIES-981 TaxID=1851505 RepID=UPI0007DE048F|nr:hypothetical protein [Cyanobium sp. NIES-981]SBO43222.1 conserved membrane protein of unknown function [Cyanobium sp. NIES-981]